MPTAASTVPELQLLRQGKVRDLYEVDLDHLLLVASDRISAFDCILPNAIPRKGEVLTQLSRFWFERFANITPNHIVTSDIDEFPETLAASLSKDTRSAIARRSMLVVRTNVIPFECVVRGYLAGSGWKDYKNEGVVCGHRLPQGLKESAKLPEPIFTPATKAEAGHDINVPIDVMENKIGREISEHLERTSLRLYTEAAAYAADRGIIICDTKFEFGIRDGRILLIDEVLTPDSSRFWPLEDYEQGRPQVSFDKQYVRDYLETLDWDKTPPAPELPPEIVNRTSEKYLEAYRLLTGRELK